MTLTAGSVLGVAYGGNIAIAIVPRGAKPIAIAAWGLVAIGGEPPPAVPGRGFPPGGTPWDVSAGSGGGWTRSAMAPIPTVAVMTVGAFCSII